MIRRELLGFLVALAPPALAAAALAAAGAAASGFGAPWWVAAGALGVAALAGVVASKRRALLAPGSGRLVASFVSARLLLIVVVGVAFSATRPGEALVVWAAVLAGLFAIVLEPPLAKLERAKREVVVNLPGVTPVPRPLFSLDWLAVASLAVTVAGGTLAAVGAPGWVWLVLALAPLPACAAATVSVVRMRAASHRATRGVRPALEALAPEFAVYYAAVHGAEYQLGMWLPYLERLGRPFVVVTRAAATVPAITSLTDAPVLVPMDLSTGSLDRMVVPSLRAAFYVQGSPANQTFQRYRQMTHIWLNHGDSDKQANFHPRHATYDRLFLSGQAGIDRYAAAGIEVAAHKFVIVGRPQVERIEYSDAGPSPEPRVLYAPTWQGGRPSTSYASLPIGPQIVRALLDRKATVVFRPHPLSHRVPADAAKVREIERILADDAAATGRAHVWGAQAETDWDVADCFNATQALVTDVSSLASEYLASGKPFAMVAMLSSGQQFLDETPTARVAYVIERDLSTLGAALDGLLGDDPLRAERAAYRRYTLGEVTGPEAAEPFLRAVRAVLDA